MSKNIQLFGVERRITVEKILQNVVNTYTYPGHDVAEYLAICELKKMSKPVPVGKILSKWESMQAFKPKRVCTLII